MSPLCDVHVETGPSVEVTVNVKHSSYIELLDNQVLPFAHHLTKEHSIPMPVLHNGNADVHRAADVTN